MLVLCILHWLSWSGSKSGVIVFRPLTWFSGLLDCWTQPDGQTESELGITISVTGGRKPSDERVPAEEDQVDEAVIT